MTTETVTSLPMGETPEKPAGEPQEPQEPTVKATSEKPATEPEEPFDKDRAMATIQKLREIEKKAKQDQKELEKYKAEEQKRIEAEMSETDRLKKQADEAMARADQLAAEILRRDVIFETGLPPILAERLRGSTKEEMLADAENLKKSLPLQKTPPRNSPINPANGEQTETEAQMRERLFGRQGNVFDIKTIQAGGGGVLWNSKE